MKNAGSTNSGASQILGVCAAGTVVAAVLASPLALMFIIGHAFDRGEIAWLSLVMGIIAAVVSLVIAIVNEQRNIVSAGEERKTAVVNRERRRLSCVAIGFAVLFAFVAVLDIIFTLVGSSY
jgi:hypothetical protein